MRQMFKCCGCGHIFPTDEAETSREPSCQYIAVCPSCYSDDLDEFTEFETGSEILDALHSAFIRVTKGSRLAVNEVYDYIDQLSEWLEEHEGGDDQ